MDSLPSWEGTISDYFTQNNSHLKDTTWVDRR